MTEVHIFDAYANTLTDTGAGRTQHYVAYALSDFPELGGKTVYVGRLSDDFGWNNENVIARADGYNRVIYFPKGEVPTLITVYHELGHLAIQERDRRGEDVPTSSEPYCSIFSVARMSPKDIDSDGIAYLGEPSVPKSEWAEICRDALEYREEHRDYIKKCKEWLGVVE
jgi:hypothetical protein